MVGDEGEQQFSMREEEGQGVEEGAEEGEGCRGESDWEEEEEEVEEDGWWKAPYSSQEEEEEGTEAGEGGERRGGWFQEASLRGSTGDSWQEGSGAR